MADPTRPTPARQPIPPLMRDMTEDETRKLLAFLDALDATGPGWRQLMVAEHLGERLALQDALEAERAGALDAIGDVWAAIPGDIPEYDQ